jgi:phosphoribosyl-ATP pyrophosphohydrolase
LKETRTVAKKIAKPVKRGKPAAVTLPTPTGVSPKVIDRLWSVVLDRRTADPAISHSARLLSRGTAKVAQKFGEEAVECIIEAVAGDKAALVAESADVLYHLLVLWVSAGVHPSEVWAELERREGVSGVAEKAARRALTTAAATRKIP